MNEPKKRGRPSKAEIEARDAFKGPRVDLTAEAMSGIGPEDFDRPVYVSPKADPAAQAYALRVWEGQSIDAPREWRIERVKAALEGQNLPFEGVVLP
jgi:hypothetical protein